MLRRALAASLVLTAAGLASPACTPPAKLAPAPRAAAATARVTAAAASGAAGGPAERASRPTTAAKQPSAPPLEVRDSKPLRTIVLPAPVFFELPLDSTRHAVSGHDPATGLCITAVFFPDEQAPRDRRCNDFGAGWLPYVVVEVAEAAGCWDYGSAARVDALRGCVDWAAFGPEHTDEATLELSIESPLWSGRVVFDEPR